MDYSYIGVGPIYIKRTDIQGGMLPLGNSPKFKIGIEEETKELRDYTSPGGGIRNKISRIKSANISLTVTDLSPDNLAMAVFGNVENVNSGSVSNETKTAYKGSFILLDKAGATSVVVKNEDGTVTYTEGEDYVVKSAGLWIPATSSITDASTIKVSYNYPKQDVVQALTTSGYEYELLFEGFNEALTGKKCNVHVWRCRFGPAKSIDFIGDDYVQLEFEGTLIADSSKSPGSQHFKVVYIS